MGKKGLGQIFTQNLWIFVTKALQKKNKFSKKKTPAPEILKSSGNHLGLPPFVLTDEWGEPLDA